MYALQDTPLSLDAVTQAVAGPDAGGLVTFTGTVRAETRGRRVLHLEYEAYPAMAERVFAAIGAEVSQRWPGARCAIAHRVGVLIPGEVAVTLAVAAPHREAAFAGCRHALERLKADAPVWKREVYEDGSAWVGLGP